jgi:hypothetical protein
VVATPRGSTMWPVIDPSDPDSNKRRNRHIETMQARPQKLHAGIPPFIAHVGSATVEDVSAAVLHFDHQSGHKDHRAVSHRTNSKKASSQRRPPRSHSPSKLKRAQQQSMWLPSQQASSDPLCVISGPPGSSQCRGHAQPRWHPSARHPPWSVTVPFVTAR